eukprot:scaffold169266_cov29-Tisochrysis_lutea.AAC.3
MLRTGCSAHTPPISFRCRCHYRRFGLEISTVGKSLSRGDDLDYIQSVGGEVALVSTAHLIGTPILALAVGGRAVASPGAICSTAGMATALAPAALAPAALAPAAFSPAAPVRAVPAARAVTPAIIRGT